MSSTLTGMVKNMRVPQRLISRKVALWALAEASNDHGKGIDAGIAEIAYVTGMSERRALDLRSELKRTGLLVLKRQGGMGAGDVSIYEINVALLKAIAEGTVDYNDLLAPGGREAAALRLMKGAVTAPLPEPSSGALPAPSPWKGDVTSPFPEAPAVEKGATTAPLSSTPTPPPEVALGADERNPKGDVKGDAKGDAKGDVNSINGVQNPPSPPSRGEVSNYNYPTKEVNFSLPPYPPLANGSEGHATSLESSEADATEEGVFNGKSGQAAATDDDPLSQVPPSRRQIAEALLASDRHREIVEHLLIPVLATLAIPAGRDPLTWLADWLDVAASAKVSVAALKAAAKKIRIERVRDLPAPRDLPPILAAAASSVLINLKPGDPRWAAWLAHDKRNPAKEANARLTERNRWPFAVDSDWPPETPNLQLRHDELGIRIELPPRTPEWCAHVQAMRASKSLSDKEKAQSLEVDPKPIDRATRWPEVVA